MGRVGYPRGVEQGRFVRRRGGGLWLWRAGCFGAVLLGGLGFEYGPDLISAAPPRAVGLPGAVETPAWLRPAPAVDHHFQGCDDARAIGMENIPASDPSYRAFMEGDGDGLSLRS